MAKKEDIIDAAATAAKKVAVKAAEAALDVAEKVLDKAAEALDDVKEAPKAESKPAAKKEAKVITPEMAKIPAGPLELKWTNYKNHQKLVNPANKRRLDVIVIGTGLAGASAAASLAEMGFNVLNFCIQDSPRRAHSIAAQGGINAAKNYQNDGDSVYRLYYDTIKGGDYRAREANVYRLAEVSNNIIDQCVA